MQYNNRIQQFLASLQQFLINQQKSIYIMDPQPQLKNFQYLIAVNFQATCQENKQPKPCQEVIQFSAIILCLNESPKIIGRFNQYVRPKCNPKLNKFCEQITGVKNQFLKNCKQIEEVLRIFQKWTQQFKVLTPQNYTFLTWGNYPLKKLLFTQIRVKKLKYPQFIHSFTSLKRVYSREVFDGNSTIPQALKQMKIDLQKEINKDNLTRNQYITQGLVQIAIKLFSEKKFSPNRKAITILYDIPNVNVTEELQYLLVLDFQATCEENVKLKPCSEIIQFPVMIIDIKTRKIIGQFHEYVMPQYNPKITKFCTQLTGITQQMVQNKPKLKEVLRRLDDWMGKQINLHSKNFTFVTCGDWDLTNCLRNEVKTKSIQTPQYLRNYINIKKVFQQIMPQFQRSMGMMGMLGALKIKHQGRHHSGIDDVRNICNVCIGLMQKGLKFSKKHINYVK